MARISLDSVISGTLINRFRGLASSGGAGSSVTRALSGNSVTISQGLRIGARTFSSAVQSLNSTIALANIGRATLEKLGELTDSMIVLAERASKASTGDQTRARLNRDFRKLADEFLRVVEKSKLGEENFLTVEGLSAIFMNVGLDKETSDSIAAVFSKFVLAEDGDSLASDEIKGTRPVRIPASGFAGPASDTTYAFSRLTNSNITSGAVYSSGAIAQDSDTPLGQNPGYESLISIGNGGTVSEMAAGSLTGDVTLKAVNEATGYSVIESSQDFLGFSAGGSQLFLVDNTGNVVHQITNNASGYTYGSVDISADNLTIAYYEDDGAGTQRVRKVEITGSIGQAPAAGNTYSTVFSGDTFSNVKLSDSGDYTAALDGSNFLLFADSSGAQDSFLLGINDAVDFGFIEDDVLAVVRPSGGSNYKVQSYRYDFGEWGADLTGDLASIDDFATLQRSGLAGYYSEVEQVTNNRATAAYIYGGGNGSGRVYAPNPFLNFEIKFEYDGAVVGTISSSSTLTLLDVNTSTGMTVFASTEDFLGYNPSRYNQIFVADSSGNILYQASNNIVSINYVDAAVSDDGLSLAVSQYRGTTANWGRVTINDDNPANNSWNLHLSATGTTRFRNLAISNDGAYITGVDNTTKRTYLYNDANQYDQFIYDQSGISSLYLYSVHFSDNAGTVLIQRDSGANYDIEEYQYGDGSFNNTLLRDVAVSSLVSTGEVSGVGSGAYAFYDSSTNSIKVYQGSTFLGSYEFQGTDTGSLRIAFNGDTGHVDLGVFGKMPSINGDNDNELYVIRSIGGAFALDYDAGGGVTRVALYDVPTNSAAATRDLSSATDTVADISLARDANGYARVGILGTLPSQGGDPDQELYTLDYNLRSSTGRRYSRVSAEFASLFSSEANIRSRPDAIRMLGDLKALREQIDDNISGMDNALKVIGDNLELVRQAGLAFLKLSDSVNTSQEAEQVARKLQMEIRRNAGAAIAQAENLEPIIVATLALEASQEE